MKKIVYILIFSLLALSCTKERKPELLLGDPNERIADTLAYVKKSLVDAPFGWKAFTTTKLTEAGYGFYMQFAQNDRLKLVADLNDNTAATWKESTYRIRQIMGATLSFDSYTYITMLQDPDPSVFGGKAGQGLGSDVEYQYVKTHGDTLFFSGRKFSQPLVLVQAKENEQKAYLSADYLQAINRNKLFFKTNPLTSIDVNGLEAELAFNFNGKKVSIILAASDGTFDYVSTSFFNTLEGVELPEGIEVNKVRLKRFVFKDQNAVVGIGLDGKEYAVKINSSSVVPYLVALGSKFTTIQVPDVETFTGWSADFVTRRNAAKAGISRWSLDPGPIILRTIDFRFQVVNNKLSVAFNCTSGNNRVTLTYNYNYTIENGRFKFTLANAPTGNEGAIFNDIRFLLQERLHVDQFELGYYVNSATGDVMSQFKSVEHPDFYFTGFNN